MTPPPPPVSPAAEFAAGQTAALNPTAAGPAVMTAASPWVSRPCPGCGHTFRVGDRVTTAPDGTVRHQGATGCESVVSAAPDQGAAAEGFVLGLGEAIGIPPGVKLTVLAAGHPLVAGPEHGRRRRKCPVCAHTFRPNEAVVICPCRPDRPECEWAVHRDAGRGLLCWESMIEAKTPCPLYGRTPR